MRSQTTSFHCRHALLPEGWRDNVRLLTEAGRVARIEVEVAPKPGDEHISIALPGMANLHSHAFQRGMAGLAERRASGGDNFWSWREIMYRFVDRLTPDDVQAIATLAYIEMLEQGFTRVAEFHYLHHDFAGRPFAMVAEMSGRIANAAELSGIGLTLLPVFYAQGGFGGQALGAAQSRFRCELDGFARLLEGCAALLRPLPDAVLGIAPHSLRAVTDQHLTQLVALAGDNPIHIHIAEQTREVEDCLAWCGRRPVEHLFDLGLVDHRWCLVHATHMTLAETAQVADSGAVAGLCPITEANLGDGLFALEEFLGRSGIFGIGSDSNVLISMAEELRWLEYGQRLTRMGRNLVAGNHGRSTGRALFDRALAGGAQACGIELGLAPGAAADIVAVDAGDPRLLARGQDDWLDSIIFAGAPIERVWRRGRLLVEQGRHVGRDAAMTLYAASLARILG